MNIAQLASLFTADPEITTRTAIRFFHFIGLALGLGGAMLLDLMMLRFFICGKIVTETFGIFDFASKIVGIGLRILWITGIGFLFFYALTNPQLLTNPKVHAKLVIVLILTVNGYFIHAVILPGVKAQIGKSLFTGVSTFKRSLFVTSGAISAVSWFFPVALGTFPQLNFAVPALTILLVYLTVIALAALGMQALIYALHRFNISQNEPLVSLDPVSRNIFKEELIAPQPISFRQAEVRSENAPARRLIVKPKLFQRNDAMRDTAA